MSNHSTTLAAPAIATAAASSNDGPITKISQLWQAAIAYQSAQPDQVPVVTALSNLYQRISPAISYQSIINVVSAVYADSFWNTNLLDPAMLSKAAQQGLGLSAALADQYSATALSQWRGLFSRKNINDNGAIPVTSSYTESLDIVCNEDAAASQTLLITQWNNEFWKMPQAGKNYVYLRCQNLSFYGSIAAPVVRIFYTQGGFNQPVGSWLECLAESTGGTTGGLVSLVNGMTQPVSATNPLNVGDRAVSEPFYFSAQAQGHYCLAAVVGDDFFANNPLGGASNWDTNQWITHNGAAAWHNLDVQQKTKTFLAFYNQDDQKEEFYFSALCRNVPKGTKLSLRNADDHSEVSFDTGVITINDPSQEVRQPVTLPANYKGRLEIHLESPGYPILAPSAAVEVTMHWLMSAEHPNYGEAQFLSRVRPSASSEQLALNMGSFTLTGGKQ